MLRGARGEGRRGERGWEGGRGEVTFHGGVLYSNFTTAVAMKLTATQVCRRPTPETIGEQLGDRPRRESGFATEKMKFN